MRPVLDYRRMVVRPVFWMGAVEGRDRVVRRPVGDRAFTPPAAAAIVVPGESPLRAAGIGRAGNAALAERGWREGRDP